MHRFVSMTAAKLLGTLALASLLPSGCRRIEPQTEDQGVSVDLTKSGVEMVAIPGGWFQMGSDQQR